LLTTAPAANEVTAKLLVDVDRHETEIGPASAAPAKLSEAETDPPPRLGLREREFDCRFGGLSG
jgi:hypothetical protein